MYVLIFRHINWSRLSPQPPFPRKLLARHIITSCSDNNSFYLVYNLDCKRCLYLPFGNFTFFFACAVVTMRFFGYRKGLAFSRIACTFFTTFSVSHCAFLWWTPLKDGTNRYYTHIYIMFLVFQKQMFIFNKLINYHSPMWNTLGPLISITWSFCFKHVMLTWKRDQSQL